MLLNSRRNSKGPVVEELDMTPMVDVVFQLMTFLLLTYQASTEPAVAMPVASHGQGVEGNDTIVLTVAKAPEGSARSPVYAGLDLDPEMRLNDDEAIRKAVEKALTSGKRRVVIQADGDVTYGEVMRVAGDAGEVQGISIHIGVKDPG